MGRLFSMMTSIILTGSGFKMMMKVKKLIQKMKGEDKRKSSIIEGMLLCFSFLLFGC